MNVKDFIKVVSEQIQRLNEVQPQIPDAVIFEYNKKFKDEPPTISKPECVNGLVDIKIYLDDVSVTPTTTAELPLPAGIKETPKKPVFR